MLTVVGLLVSSVIQRQVRLSLRTHDQQSPGNTGATATQWQRWYWPCLPRSPWGNFGEASTQSRRCTVSNPITCSSVMPSVLTTRGMKRLQRIKPLSSVRLLERGPHQRGDTQRFSSC